MITNRLALIACGLWLCSLPVSAQSANPDVSEAPSWDFELGASDSYELAQASQVHLDDLSRNQSRDVQLLLQEDGYSPGPADGFIGTRSKRAIASWAADRGYAYQPGFLPSQLFSESVIASEERPAGGSSGTASGGGGSCGWYAIYTCNTSRSSAQSAANRYGGFVINTSSSAYPNFNPGFFCAGNGPAGSKGQAQSWANSAKSRGASSAYVKNAC